MVYLDYHGAPVVAVSGSGTFKSLIANNADASTHHKTSLFIGKWLLNECAAWGGARIELIDVNTMKNARELTGHDMAVLDLSLVQHPQQSIISCSFDRTVCSSLILIAHSMAISSSET